MDMPLVFHLLVFGWLGILGTGLLMLYFTFRKKTVWKKKVILLLILFLLILISRAAVNLYGVNEAAADPDPLVLLSPLERILDSVVHALQSFSMDENYTDYIVKGKQLFSEVYGPVWGTAYAVIISLLNILAPVTGGAVLLDILIGIFPQFRIRISPWCRKVVFSELNEQSVTLAEDIFQNYQKLFPEEENDDDRRPLIIFTDAYLDQKSEESTEVYERARRINAVCIKTDLEQLSLKHSKSIHYILVDNDEQSNIKTLVGLLDVIPEEKADKKEKTNWFRNLFGKEENGFRRIRIYVIFHSEEACKLADNICRKKNTQNRCLVRTINDYAHAAAALMADMPLFVPLLESKQAASIPEVTGKTVSFGQFRTQYDDVGRIGGVIPERELRVTILGSGNIAEEVFKTVFWCGQMSGIQLVMNIISMDTTQMMRRMRSRCPEIFRTCVLQKNGACSDAKKKPKELLKIYRNSELTNPPYAVINWWNRYNAENIKEYPPGILKNTHYYVVALGEDKKNSEVTLMLKRELSRLMLEQEPGLRPVITTPVYDNRLADSLLSADITKVYEPYVFPFATLKKRYSCSNIFFSDFYREAEKTEELYGEKQQEEYYKDSYNYWSNIAKVIHAPYKMYGLGRITKYTEGGTDRYSFEYKKGSLDEHEQTVFRWMEKRRWNAYMRTRGFIRMTDTQHKQLYASQELHKDLENKLHNCLVECSLKKVMDPQTYPQDFDMFDNLDMVAVRVYEMETESRCRSGKGLKEKDYKKYDGIGYDPAAEKLIS